MFDLKLYHHRIFECSFPVAQPDHPEHDHQQAYSVVGRPASGGRQQRDYQSMVATWPVAMGIPDISVNASTSGGGNMFSQAIPPAFAKYLVEQFLTWRAAQA